MSSLYVMMTSFGTTVAGPGVVRVSLKLERDASVDMHNFTEYH